MPTVTDTGSVSLAFEEKKVAWDVIRKQAGGKDLCLTDRHPSAHRFRAEGREQR